MYCCNITNIGDITYFRLAKNNFSAIWRCWWRPWENLSYQKGDVGNLGDVSNIADIANIDNITDQIIFHGPSMATSAILATLQMGLFFVSYGEFATCFSYLWFNCNTSSQKKLSRQITTFIQRCCPFSSRNSQRDKFLSSSLNGIYFRGIYCMVVDYICHICWYS